MSNHDERFEEYLDRRAQDDSCHKASTPEDSEQWRAELQLQDKLDASLNRMFSLEPVDEEQYRNQIESIMAKTEATNWKRQVRIWVLAASILVFAAIGYWQFGGTRSSAVAFKRVPLVELYQDTIARGFKPYYVCDDPPRFAAEFDKRQGVPLRLKPMPDQHQMVGISYLGGISRDSTVMLGLASKKPVLVFVDRIENDNDDLQEQVGAIGDLFVTRAEKEGLVFYEVSSFQQPQLIPYFERDTAPVD